MYEKLQKEATQHGIDIFEKPIITTIKGLYGDKIIWINKSIETTTEKACVLAEELGHYHTSSGDILDQKQITNRKQEKRARKWAYEKLVPLKKIVQAYQAGVKNRYELAEFIGVTEEFLTETIKSYQEKYGVCVALDRFTIYFSPLGVMEMFEE